MNALLLLAALSSQITFNTTQQGDVYTIIPEVTLTQSCLCRVQILSLREGSSGQSQTKQEKTLSLPANQPIALTKLSLNISPEDRVKIVVTVSDGQSFQNFCRSTDQEWRCYRSHVGSDRLSCHLSPDLHLHHYHRHAG